MLSTKISQVSIAVHILYINPEVYDREGTTPKYYKLL
jgi:hypothetical protein